MKISPWRIAVLALLFLAPVLFLIGFGVYNLWFTWWGVWVGFPMILSMALAYYLAARWQARKMLLPPINLAPPVHLTERDEQAWQLIKARAEDAKNVDPAKLIDIKFYAALGQEMSLELARVYYPKAKDPVGRLTVPEILAVVELVAHDMAEMVEQYIPGGHLMTIDHWRTAQQAAGWYPTVSNAYWAISAIFAPYNTAARYLASRVGIGKPMEMLRQNLLLWFYTAYVHRIGTYLIDLYAGRLRVGAERYRQLVRKEAAQAAGAEPTSAAAEGAAPPPAAAPVTLTLFGQVKAGKSSLINALLGDQQAVTSTLPETAQVTCYELKPDDGGAPMLLLDTVGYGHEGPRQDDLRATEEAARRSDILLLVLRGRDPARQADLQTLRKLREWFRSNPDLKMPPVIAVLTHIDLLTPAMEWSPPYDWQKPTRPKEKQIAAAVATVREQLGEYLADVVPVCTAAGKVYGIEEGLLPALASRLDQGQAVAMLRNLHLEAKAERLQKVLGQVLSGGKEILRALWDQAKK